MSHSVLRSACPGCGAQARPDDQVCALCGSELTLEATAEAPVEASAAPVSELRRMSLAIGTGGILLTAALFSITLISKHAYAPRPTMQGQVTEASAPRMNSPLKPTSDTIERARALREAADALTGADRAARLAAIVNLYLSEGAFSEAAATQEEVARELGSAAAWADAGNLYYRGMQDSDGAGKQTEAQKAIQAYHRALEIDPDNLDVRTDMATAYLATDNPMEGVRQLRRVLGEDADHVQANFNYGVMLSMIGQTGQAAEQFKRVTALVDPGSDTYRQALEALQELGRN